MHRQDSVPEGCRAAACAPEVPDPRRYRTVHAHHRNVGPESGDRVSHTQQNAEHHGGEGWSLVGDTRTWVCAERRLSEAPPPVAAAEYWYPEDDRSRRPFVGERLHALRCLCEGIGLLSPCCQCTLALVTALCTASVCHGAGMAGAKDTRLHARLDTQPPPILPFSTLAVREV